MERKLSYPVAPRLPVSLKSFYGQFYVSGVRFMTQYHYPGIMMGIERTVEMEGKLWYSYFVAYLWVMVSGSGFMSMRRWCRLFSPAVVCVSWSDDVAMQLTINQDSVILMCEPHFEIIDILKVKSSKKSFIMNMFCFVSYYANTVHHQHYYIGIASRPYVPQI